MVYRYTPFTSTLDLDRWNNVLAEDPTRAMYGLLDMGGYRTDPATRSQLGNIAPLLEVFRTIDTGLGGVKGQNQAINQFGGYTQALLNHNGNMVNDELANINKIGNMAGGTPTASVQNQYLSNPSSVMGDVQALLGAKLGGRLTNRFFGSDAISNILAQLAEMQTAAGSDTAHPAMNAVQLLQKLGYM